MMFRLVLTGVLFFVCHECSCFSAALKAFSEKIRSDGIQKSLTFWCEGAIKHVVKHALERHLGLSPDFYFYDEGSVTRIRSSFKVADRLLHRNQEIIRRQKAARLISTLRKLWGIEDEESDNAKQDIPEIEKIKQKTEVLLSKMQKEFDEVSRGLAELLQEIVDVYSGDPSLKKVEDFPGQEEPITFEMLESAEQINNTSGQDVSDGEEDNFVNAFSPVDGNSFDHERETLKQNLASFLPNCEKDLNRFLQSLSVLCGPFNKLVKNYEAIEDLCRENDNRIVEHVEAQKKPILSFCCYIDLLRKYISQQFFAFKEAVLNDQATQQDVRRICREFLQTLEQVKKQFNQTKVYVYGADFDRTSLSNILKDLEKNTTVSEEILFPVSKELERICKLVLTVGEAEDGGDFRGLVVKSNDLGINPEVIDGFFINDRLEEAPLDGSENRSRKESGDILLGINVEENTLVFSTLFPIPEQVSKVEEAPQ